MLSQILVKQVTVLLPLPLADPYYIYDCLEKVVTLGAFVQVPFRNHLEIGVVWGFPTIQKVTRKFRKISVVLDIPPIPVAVMQFIDRVATYTISSPGAVLKMVVTIQSTFKVSPFLKISSHYNTHISPILCWLTQEDTTSLESQAGKIDISPVYYKEIEVYRANFMLASMSNISVILSSFLDHYHASTSIKPTLSPDQKKAAEKLVTIVTEKYFSVTLLEGVTGSGKTEVYIEAIATILQRGDQVLVLLPEIALATQWTNYFSKRFSESSVIWHSGLKENVRRNLWYAVSYGAARLIIGARSALFLPYKNLGLIVVDEEHDPSFRQEDGVLYHARDMAVVRGQIGRHAVILSSATPSLETKLNTSMHRYNKVCLKERYGRATLPVIVAVDMRYTRVKQNSSWLSPQLASAIEQTIRNGEQVMLFLNRRGYAPLLLCHVCGFRFCCPHCTSWLVKHRHIQSLQCHHCGYITSIPCQCPICGEKDSFIACGPGVERVAEEVSNRFPFIRFTLVTSDNQFAASSIVHEMSIGILDMLIGTQVLSKGYHFPKLTLVGVIDADLGLNGGDLRAAERTFQLLSQVSGRAGRAAHPGRVLIQTYNPTHPVMVALLSGVYEDFYREELEQREETGMPPFGKLASLVISGYNLLAVKDTAIRLIHQKPQGYGITVLGPAPAPLAMLRGRYRWRILLKVSKLIRIQPVLRTWITKVQLPQAVRVQIDVDPYHFL